MHSKSFKYALSVITGLLLCSCVFSPSKESENITIVQEQPKLQEDVISEENILSNNQPFKNQKINEILTNQKALLDENYQHLLKKQEDQKKLTSLKEKELSHCFSPVYEDGTCIHNWSDLEKIPCKPGFFNTVKEGGQGMFGKVLTFDEVDKLACEICWEEHYCPGNGHRYKCPGNKEIGATACPTNLHISNKERNTETSEIERNKKVKPQTKQNATKGPKENSGFDITVFNANTKQFQSFDEYLNFFAEHPEAPNKN